MTLVIDLTVDEPVSKKTKFGNAIPQRWLDDMPSLWVDILDLYYDSGLCMKSEKMFKVFLQDLLRYLTKNYSKDGAWVDKHKIVNTWAAIADCEEVFLENAANNGIITREAYEKLSYKIDIIQSYIEVLVHKTNFLNKIL